MTQPSLTYYIDKNLGRISSMVDQKDSLLQSVFKALDTEKYGFLIYSWFYGFDPEPFIGQDFDYVQTNLGQYVKECLLKDDRIQDIVNFKVIEQSIDSCLSTFDIISTEGLIQDVTKEFKYGN